MNKDQLDWNELEKRFPECSAAWDRDVGGKLTIERLFIEPDGSLVAYIVECDIHTTPCGCKYYNTETKQWREHLEPRPRPNQANTK